jgi:hypothetical protein
LLYGCRHGCGDWLGRSIDGLGLEAVVAEELVVTVVRLQLLEIVGEEGLQLVVVYCDVDGLVGN